MADDYETFHLERSCCVQITICQACTATPPTTRLFPALGWHPREQRPCGGEETPSSQGKEQVLLGVLEDLVRTKDSIHSASWLGLSFFRYMIVPQAF